MHSKENLPAVSIIAQVMLSLCISKHNVCVHHAFIVPRLATCFNCKPFSSLTYVQTLIFPMIPSDGGQPNQLPLLQQGSSL